MQAFLVINPFAVLLCGVANMVIGMIWYSPMLFGNQWMKQMGFSAKRLEEMKKGKKMPMTYGLSFLAALVQGYVLSLLYSLSLLAGVPGALLVAFFAWLGFVLVTQFTDLLFSEKSRGVLLINGGYQLASLLAMGVVVGLMV